MGLQTHALDTKVADNAGPADQFTYKEERNEMTIILS